MKNKIYLGVLLINFLCLSYADLYSQGNFPIIANIGYAAAQNEVKTHFSVPGAIPGSPGDPFSYQVASGSYSIYYATNNKSGKIIKPIIIAEGFDPTDYYSPDDVINLLNGGSSASDDVANSLRQDGFDLIVLDYDDGGQLIQRNAFLLVRLIQHINAIKQSTCPIIVAGYSMGGIVARYALNYMEANALPHNVGLFFSFDSPQKGANIPLSMQDMADWMDNNVVTYGLSADIQDQVRSIHSYAAQQMLIYHTDFISGDNAIINPAFTQFYNQMKGLVGGNGYPVKCKKIAASLGSWVGVGQLYMNGANQWVNHNGAPLPSNPVAFSFIGVKDKPFIGYTLVGQASPLPYNINVPPSGLPFGIMYISVASAVFNGDHQTGYYNAPIPADMMPGSFAPIFEDVASSLNGLGVNTNIRMPGGCFIPTVSALDFSSNDWYHNIEADLDKMSKTPFASIFATSGNFDHKFPINDHLALANWILNEVALFNATTLGCDKGALPVKLSSFSAARENETTVLHWVTDEEINLDRFVIERSQNNKDWVEIGHIYPEKIKKDYYIYKDERPFTGKNWYRLKMVDKDGTFAFSRIKDTNFGDRKIVLYPNPVANELNLSEDRNILDITIYDIMGREIYHSNKTLNKIPVKNLVLGPYLVKIRFKDGSESNELILKE